MSEFILYEKAILSIENVSLHRRMVTSMEAKYWHLLINHHKNELLKVKCRTDGFIELKREST